MPSVRARRKKSSGRPGAQLQICPPPAHAILAQPLPGPVRGLKLKTVSRATILFALICLAAFMAGRPPVSAENYTSLDSSRADRATAHHAKSAHGMIMRGASANGSTVAGKRTRRKAMSERERRRPLGSFLHARSRNTRSRNTSASLIVG